jgi:hypothetical protein
MYLSPQARDLTILEADIRRTMVPGHLRQKKFARYHLNGKRLGVVVHAYHPSMVGSLKLVDNFQAGLNKNPDPISK